MCFYFIFYDQKVCYYIWEFCFILVDRNISPIDIIDGNSLSCHILQFIMLFINHFGTSAWWGQKKIYMFQVSALKKLGKVGLHYQFIKIFYIEIAFFTAFFTIFDNILLTIHAKIFMVRAKT